MCMLSVCICLYTSQMDRHAYTTLSLSSRLLVSLHVQTWARLSLTSARRPHTQL